MRQAVSQAVGQRVHAPVSRLTARLDILTFREAHR